MNTDYSNNSEILSPSQLDALLDAGIDSGQFNQIRFLSVAPGITVRQYFESLESFGGLRVTDGKIYASRPGGDLRKFAGLFAA